MATYSKASGVGGSWVKKEELKNGQRAKILTESVPATEEYQGKPKTRNIVKIQFEGDKESKNVDLNRPTVNGLIDAFGTDSNDWVGKYLTVAIEKMLIAGKRQIALYLLAEGFEVAEDDGGYLIVQRIGADMAASAPSPEDFPDATPDEEIDAASIPF